MSAIARYLVLCATRTRAPLPALAAVSFLVIGVFFYPDNEVGATWGLTSVLTCGLAAWLIGAVLAGEPPAQADMATAALGGRRRRAMLELLLSAAAAALLAAVFVVYPLALIGIAGIENEFERTVRIGDVGAALLAHLCCGLLGGAIAVLFSPPRLPRRASAIAAVLAALLGLAAIGGAAGPVAVARALDDAAPGTVTGAALVACLGCLALAAVAFAAAARWAARSG